MVNGFSTASFKTHRGKDAKRHSFLRLIEFGLFRNIVDNLSLNLRNILISPLEGDKEFLGELGELRNFKKGFNLKRSCRNSNSDLPKQLRCTLLNKFLMLGRKFNLFSDTVFSPFTSHFSHKRTAFTLAEVLITLGIIGIVASLTLPNIIYNYQKHVVETRLQKFYSTINQAVRLTEQDYGDRENWAQQGNQNEIEFINKYYVPYLNVTKTKKIAWNKPYVLYFEDGSALGHSGWGRDWLFFPGDPEKCLKQEKYIGRCAFSFYFNPIPGLYRENNFEPFSFAMTNNDDFIRNDSVRGCNNNGGSGSYCTKLIQRNGWKIPKDYPYRIRF